ncbi:MAG: GatB/YqeY domain-containing protein [Acidobacteria bacterium]|nr:GatB/YqeY domain-containing protein [Acidobacteriota bacterium]
MSTPQETIQTQIKEALKAGDKDRLSTLRLLLAAIKNETIRAGEEVDEAGFLKLVRKAIKQRKDSAEQYRKGDREELASKEEREAEILAAYLPPQVDEEELRSSIAALVESEGLAGPAAIGTIMKTMMAKYAGRTDGGTVNKIARKLLGV